MKRSCNHPEWRVVIIKSGKNIGRKFPTCSVCVKARLNKNRGAYLSRCKKNNAKPINRYRNLVCSSRTRNLPMNLSKEDYFSLLQLPCFYCGQELSPCGGGLDRIASDSGYVLGNVRPCCGRCNEAKMDLSDSDFKEWVERVYKHYVRS
jgi:hypothetical protein